MNKLLGYIQTQAGGGTMKRKLFLYMLLLLFFILLVLASMLSLMGQFKTPKDSLLETYSRLSFKRTFKHTGIIYP